MKIFMVMPTWNNATMCGEAIRTLFEYTDFEKYGELCIIDNSTEDQGTHLSNICAKYGARYRKQDENLGWMRSINQGQLDYPAPDFELFNMCNDDVVFPQDSEFWPRTLKLFEDSEVGGVGPVSNYVMGWQQHRIPITDDVGEVELLIGFCATYRTKALQTVGLLDTALPGGDDLDLSIRMRAAGYKLLCDRRSFVYHYGSVTGTRVHSDWDTQQSQLKTVNALIRKHGMLTWHKCVQSPWRTYGEPLIPRDLQDRILKAVWDINEHVMARKIDVREGSCPPRELSFLAREVRNAKIVCQIGLNAGHSAIAMLVANPDLTVVSYDLGEWDCAKYAAEYLREHFEDRHVVIWGDSKDTIPKSALDYDFAFIDGGHDYETAVADLRNLAPRSKRVMLDDLQMPEVRRAWTEALAAGLVSEPEEFSDRLSDVTRFWGVARGGR